MSHIDESKISALIDGDPSLPLAERKAIDLHLKGCEICASLAREIEANVAAARDILSASGPEVIDRPGFEDVVVRAQERTVQSGKRLRGVNPGLAAAAVLVIAVSVTIYSGRLDQIVDTGAPVGAVIRNAESTQLHDTQDPTQPRTVATPAEEAQRQTPSAGASFGSGTVAARSRATPADEIASPPGAPAEAVVIPNPEVGEVRRTEAIAQDLAADAGSPVAVESEARASPRARRADRERRAPVVAMVGLVDRTAEAEENRACVSTPSYLASGKLPLALKCAAVLGVELDTLAGTPVTWITQQLEGGAVFWLAVASENEIQPGFQLALTTALATKWQATKQNAQPEGNHSNGQNVVATEANGYLVWVSSGMSRALLEEIAARLRTGD